MLARIVEDAYLSPTKAVKARLSPLENDTTVLTSNKETQQVRKFTLSSKNPGNQRVKSKMSTAIQNLTKPKAPIAKDLGNFIIDQDAKDDSANDGNAADILVLIDGFNQKLKNFIPSQSFESQTSSVSADASQGGDTTQVRSNVKKKVFKPLPIDMQPFKIEKRIMSLILKVTKPVHIELPANRQSDSLSSKQFKTKSKRTEIRYPTFASSKMYDFPQTNESQKRGTNVGNDINIESFDLVESYSRVGEALFEEKQHMSAVTMNRTSLSESGDNSSYGLRNNNNSSKLEEQRPLQPGHQTLADISTPSEPIVKGSKNNSMLGEQRSSLKPDRQALQRSDELHDLSDDLHEEQLTIQLGILDKEAAVTNPLEVKENSEFKQRVADIMAKQVWFWFGLPFQCF